MYPNQIKEIRGKGCLQGIFFQTGPEIINKVLKFIPIKLTKDNRFLSKLITSSVLNSLYNDYQILTSLGQNKEICLWISPPIIANKEQINYFFESLEKILKEGLITSILSFLKKQIF